MTLPPFHWWRTVFFLIPAISRLHDRARRDLAHRRPLRLVGAMGAPLRAVVGAGDSVDERREVVRERHAARRGHRASSSSPITRASTTRRSSSPPCRGSCRLMAKAALGYVPFIGWHLARSGHLLVNRQNPGASIFKKMQRMVRQGASLFVFPEGSRSTDGQLKRFKGGHLPARDRERPAGRARDDPRQPRRDAEGAAARRPATVHVTVHEAIRTSSLTRDDARGLATKVQRDHQPGL